MQPTGSRRKGRSRRTSLLVAVQLRQSSVRSLLGFNSSVTSSVASTSRMPSMKLKFHMPRHRGSQPSQTFCASHQMNPASSICYLQQFAAWHLRIERSRNEEQVSGVVLRTIKKVLPLENSVCHEMNVPSVSVTLSKRMLWICVIQPSSGSLATTSYTKVLSTSDISRSWRTQAV